MKIYPDKPYVEQKRDAQTDGKKTGLYDNPKRDGTRGVIAAVAVVLMVLIAIYFLSGFSYPENDYYGLSQLARNALAEPDMVSPS